MVNKPTNKNRSILFLVYQGPLDQHHCPTKLDCCQYFLQVDHSPTLRTPLGQTAEQIPQPTQLERTMFSPFWA